MSKLTYKVFNIKTQEYEDDVFVDQDGKFFSSTYYGLDYLDNSYYEVHSVQLV